MRMLALVVDATGRGKRKRKGTGTGTGSSEKAGTITACKISSMSFSCSDYGPRCYA